MIDCQRFDRRMQDRLDAREPIDEDVMLREHAESCAACRRRRDAWLRVERALLPASDASEVGHGAERGAGAELGAGAERGVWPKRGDRRHTGRVAVVAVTAAAVLLLVTVRRFNAEPPGPSPVVVASAGDRPAVGAVPSGMPVADGSAAWIGDFSRREWFDRTMPAVRSMRDGVAPLGRSFLQAVTILSHGGGPSRDASFDHGGGTSPGQGGGMQTS